MAKARKFGTFGGVFTPSILTILGVIMYMRLPMIAGEAGLFGTLGIILVAHLISVTTGLSVSSIATDKKVKEGGTYYIISRSLGLPIGGTLGLALFVGLSFSVSLYLIGFSESFLGYFDMPMDINHIRLTGSIVLLTVTIITFISTSLAIRTQYLIMTAIGLSLLSIFFGNHDLTPSTPNFFGKGSGVPLMVLFGIFFPAVTGFEAGVSMSGDLKDPKKSIPFGTISAIAIGLVAYIGLAFFFAYTVDGEMLATDNKALFKIALVPQLVIAGIWGATLSSALGSILAAPRILQSTAMDKITPRIFARGAGAAKEPRNALLLTFLIAEAGILIGQLDVIARIVSIFFITTYGFLNLSAAFESLTSADFRPSFKTPAWVSIIGSLACILVMIQLDFLAMIMAVVILGSLFLLLKRRQLVLETGDAWSSVWASLVRTGIFRLNKSALKPRNWRPNIILFCGQDSARPHLVEIAKALTGRFGIFSAFEMVETNALNLIKDQRYFTGNDKKQELLIHQHTCRDIYSGMDEIARVYGFSGIEPNTILMGWSKNENRKDQFLKLIRNFEQSDFNSIFLYYNPLRKFGQKKTIDVWWSGWGSNLAFSISLLRHITAAGDWKDARLRLLVINNDHVRTENIYKMIRDIIDSYRIDLEIKIIDNSHDALPKHEIISKESASADLTFIGIPDKQYQHINNTWDDVLLLSQQLGTFFLVNSSSGFESFDLDLDKKKDEPKALSTAASELPELTPSRYAVINEDIAKIDANGQKVLALFVEKTFAPLFSELRKSADDLNAAVNAVFNLLKKLESLDDYYRRSKAIIKAKNEFYFRVKKIFANLNESELKHQKENMENGLQWYIQRLDEDLLKFPHKLKIPYERKDLMINRRDPARIKLFKLSRRLAHPFSRHTITGKIRYQAIAAYYLRNNRHHFLSAFLDKYRYELWTNLSKFRIVILSVDHLLDQFLAKLNAREEFLFEAFDNQNVIYSKVQELISDIESQHEQLWRRLMLEYRKNLQLMSNDMGKVDINYRIRQKQRKRKYYEALVRKNALFPELWYESTMHQVNKIQMDVLLQALKGRIKDKISEFNLKVIQQLEVNYSKELKAIRTKLEKFRNKPGDLMALSMAIRSFEEHITIMSEFEKFGLEIVKLTESLPESMVIANNGESENALKVPLRKIARFYIDSRFLGSTHDKLESFDKMIKGSVFIIQDLLNLTRFNLENIPEEITDRGQLVAPIITDTCQKIMQEEDKTLKIKDNINELLQQALQEVFDQLSSYKMPATLAEYSYFIREHQGKIFRRTFDHAFDRAKGTLRHLTATLLYSRSEGVLLAKKVLEENMPDTGNQRFLSLVEALSPDEKVLSHLPQFYKNLFSGRSSINEDFWIKRKHDEELFRTAVKRYQSGYHGGIMVTGERNSGKTALCRNMADKLFKKDRIYHIYPPLKGSAVVSDFESEFQKVANQPGTIREILESVPQGCVFIIHDLELWWERNSSGWAVVNLVVGLIDDFSRKCLFIINMNPFAFELMNKITGLYHKFISVIPLMPFDSLELKEMILRRHRSSGLKFILRKNEEDELSEIRLARLFNKYFDYSEGNPGTALQIWIASIVRVTGNSIYIRTPMIPDTKAIEDMEEDWKILLIQMILHKRLTSEKISRIFHQDESRNMVVIRSLLRAGLIMERNEDLYMLQSYIEPHIIRTFRKEGLL